MSSSPWKEWIPGALNDLQLKHLIDNGFIENAAGCGIDYSSFDLRLDRDVYEMIQGSVKPHGGAYEQFLTTNSKYSRHKHLSDKEEFVLEPKKTYVFKLRERLAMKLRGSPIYGQATAKSSVGRMDVLARLIVDGMHSYEEFDETVWQNNGGGNGSMFLEITPITFRVKVRPGDSLSQLRLFCGKPEESEIKGDELYQAVLQRDDGEKVDEFLRVNVGNVAVGIERAAAFRAKRENTNPVSLWAKDDSGKLIENRPKPTEYWDLVESEGNRFRITERNFYILRSKERIILRRGICVYCRAIDETIGEMRIHYAGFVHPYFGFHIEGDKIVAKGTPLIFEVRGHDVDVVLNDNEPLARLQFYRMSEDCAENPDKRKFSAYHDQILKLSQFFGDWPDNN